MKKISKMRFLLLLLLVMLGAGSASAQIQKGTFFVEGDFGNIGINNNNGHSATNDTIRSSSKSRSFSFNLYPEVGYFITDNLALGAGLNLYFYNGSYDYLNADEIKTSTSKSSNMSLGLTPFARYYFARSGDGKSAFYGQLMVGLQQDLKYNYTSESFDTLGVVTSTFRYDYSKPYKYLYGSAMVGWNRMLSKNVALNLSLGYRYLRSSQSYSYIYSYPDGTSTTSDLYKTTSVSGNFSWNGGVTMFIPTK